MFTPKANEASTNYEQPLLTSEEGAPSYNIFTPRFSLPLNNFGRTNLHNAAMNGRWEDINLILNLGMTPDQPDSQGRTALHYAASFGHDKAARELLAQGANPNAADKDGYTPLHCSVERGNIKVAEMLIDRVDVNQETVGGMTVLDHATLNGYPEIVRLLLAHKALVDHVDKNGNTALHLAAMKGYAILAEMLIDYGADRDIKTLNGKSPLSYALQGRDDETIQLLLSKNVIVDQSILENITEYDQTTQDALKLHAIFWQVCSTDMIDDAEPASTPEHCIFEFDEDDTAELVGELESCNISGR